MSANPLVFVSHSSKDAARANELVAELERRGITCWIAPRNIAAGTEYDDAIIQALNKCDALVVLISEASISSRHVRSEVSRAASDGKRILPIRLVDVEIKGGLKFFLELSQYVDLFGHPTSDIIDSVAAALKGTRSPAALEPRPSPKSALKARNKVLGAAAIALLAFIFVGYLFSSIQQAAREEEAMRQQRIVDSLQVHPEFELRRRYIVLTSWSMTGNGSSNWKGVSAHWLINGTDKVPFDYAMPREEVLAKAAGFSTLSLVLDVPGVQGPVKRDFSFEIRKLINNQAKVIRESLNMGLSVFNCGDGGCYFEYKVRSLCSPAMDSLKISPVFVDGKLQQEPLNIPLYFCDRLLLSTPDGGPDRVIVCLPDSDERTIDQSQQPQLVVTLSDDSFTWVHATSGNLIGTDPPECSVSL